MKKSILLISLQFILAGCGSGGGEADATLDDVPNSDVPNSDVPNSDVPNSDVPNIVEPFISEYSEGSGSNRYIEIYNNSDAELPLADYAFALSQDGADIEGAWDIWGNFELSASIAARSVFSICHLDSDDRIKSQCDMLIDNLPDGNDGFALVKGTVSNYEVLDRIGDWRSVAPSIGWDVCGYSAATAGRTLIKKPFAGGSENWSASAGTSVEDCAWLVLVEDDWTNFGTHSSSENPNLVSAFKLLDSTVILQDYNPEDKAFESDLFEGVIEAGAINFDLLSAPLKLTNLTNAAENGDFQDAVLRFTVDSTLPSTEASALVDLYITTGIDSVIDEKDSQIHCQVVLNIQSNGATASISEPPQEITLAVTKPSLKATTIIGPFDIFEVSSVESSGESFLELKLMAALNEAVKIAPELVTSLLVPRRLHVRVVTTLPLIDSGGAEVTEINAKMKIK